MLTLLICIFLTVNETQLKSHRANSWLYPVSPLTCCLLSHHRWPRALLSRTSDSDGNDSVPAGPNHTVITLGPERKTRLCRSACVKRTLCKSNGHLTIWTKEKKRDRERDPVSGPISIPVSISTCGTRSEISLAPSRQALLKQIAGLFSSCTLNSVGWRERNAACMIKTRRTGGGVSWDWGQSTQTDLETLFRMDGWGLFTRDL